MTADFNQKIRLLLLLLLLISGLSRRSFGLEVDSGYNAIELSKLLDGYRLTTHGSHPSISSRRINGWVRIHGLNLTNVEETRAALADLRTHGLYACGHLRLPEEGWKKVYLPDALSKIYEQRRQLAAAFGDLVDAWEVDNEPDLGFVPESAERYTAFLKATYLGLKAGAAEAKEKAESGKLKAEDLEQRADGRRQTSDVSRQRAPLVIMGSLGLPPGPWLERFAANDGFAYTDGFNYHYYGYADDFTGVYKQHERAVGELTTALVKAETGKLKAEGSDKPATDGPNSQLSAFSSQLSPASVQKNLPVFLTEVGYGMLGKAARDTKEGRLRQWRWFKSVGEQIAILRPEAPMAFYLRPYLEYDTSEYGLTVPAKQETEKAETGRSAGSAEMALRSDGRRPTESGASRADEVANLKAEIFIAGGIEYSPGDFGVEKAEPWMGNIGKEIGKNQATPALAQWLARRSAQASTNSRAWTVSANAPSPVVIDFLSDEGLSHIKRYNGLFVTAKSQELGAGSKEHDKKPETKPTPQTSSPKPQTPPVRAEEFILQVRTQNGNLYEVYPTRQATPDWQRFMEPGDNFTMAFYGRAALPWRFKDNKPASLVVVMYPKQLPATYEFRRPQILRLGKPLNTEVAENAERDMRYGQGKVVVYNFSDKPTSGRLILPKAVGRVIPNAPGTDDTLTLAPNERREIPISVKVPWGRYARIEAPITFVPEDTNVPPARYLTALIPDIAGLPATLVASLLPQEVGRVIPNAPSNRDIALSRPRAAEEAAMTEQSGWFAQSGAQVARTAEGFTITVSSIPTGKPQRIEVEIPWPDGLAFDEEEFLSMEFRLRP